MERINLYCYEIIVRNNDTKVGVRVRVTPTLSNKCQVILWEKKQLSDDILPVGCRVWRKISEALKEQPGVVKVWAREYTEKGWLLNSKPRLK